MATEAKAIDVLMNKGNFEPQVALAIAEAVALIMTDAQVVTVPVLDARVAELKTLIKEGDHKVDLVQAGLGNKIDLFRAELDTKIDRVQGELGNKIDLFRAELDTKIDRVKGELESKIDRVKAELDNKIDLFKADLEKLIESTKSELVRWVLLAMLGSGAIQAGAAAFINAVQHH